MAAYLIALIDVTNPAAYQEYARRAGPATAENGGRMLARGGRTVTLEGAEAPGRVVVIEFPTLEAAVAHYNSAAYQEAVKFRLGAAQTQFMVVEGV